jgi:hypothetical protein
MFDDPRGPIEHFSWGKFIVSGKEHSGKGPDKIGKGKDLIVVGDEVKRWKNRKGHLLDKSMVEEILDYKVDILVIGNGVEGALEVPDKVISYLTKNGVSKVIVKKTPEACNMFNSFVHEGKKVGLMVHGTC